MKLWLLLLFVDVCCMLCVMCWFCFARGSVTRMFDLVRVLSCFRAISNYALTHRVLFWVLAPIVCVLCFDLIPFLFLLFVARRICLLRYWCRMSGIVCFISRIVVFVFPRPGPKTRMLVLYGFSRVF